MRQISDVGKEVLSGNPAPFYVFTGPEYGIKQRYIDLITKHYGTKAESGSVESVLNLMRATRLLSLEPCVYIIRYDDEFIKSLSESTQIEIASTNIVGTIVCLYESKQSEDRCKRYIPDFSVRFDPVNKSFMEKYLLSEFGESPYLHRIATVAQDYSTARNLCECMRHSGRTMMTVDIEHALFCKTDSLASIKSAVTHRNFSELVKVIDSMSDVSGIHLEILSALVDIEKSVRKNQIWDYNDLHAMFSHTIQSMNLLRSTVSDAYNSLIELGAIMQMHPIPVSEVFHV